MLHGNQSTFTVTSISLVMLRHDNLNKLHVVLCSVGPDGDSSESRSSTANSSLDQVCSLRLFGLLICFYDLSGRAGFMYLPSTVCQRQTRANSDVL